MTLAIATTRARHSDIAMIANVKTLDVKFANLVSHGGMPLIFNVLRWVPAPSYLIFGILDTEVVGMCIKSERNS